MQVNNGSLTNKDGGDEDDGDNHTIK